MNAGLCQRCSCGWVWHIWDAGLGYGGVAWGRLKRAWSVRMK